MNNLFELCDVESQLFTCYGEIIQPIEHSYHKECQRNQSNGDIAEEDIDVISHHVIGPMLSCRISSSCMINLFSGKIYVQADM